MKQSTDKKKNTWLARCREPDCDEIRVKCPICKHGGHISPHRVTSDPNNPEVQISIQHSHFVENQDAGRNMYCDTGDLVAINENDIIPSWKLNAAGRRRLIDNFVGKYT
jgi:hypothetical protein